MSVRPGIQAVAEVPIFCKDKLYGFLGVDDPQGGMESTELLTHIAYFISDEVQKRELHARLLANSYYRRPHRPAQPPVL